jgi:hypothetical protein
LDSAMLEPTDDIVEIAAGRKLDGELTKAG